MPVLSPEREQLDIGMLLVARAREDAGYAGCDCDSCPALSECVAVFDALCESSGRRVRFPCGLEAERAGSYDTGGPTHRGQLPRQ